MLIVVGLEFELKIIGCKKNISNWLENYFVFIFWLIIWIINFVSLLMLGGFNVLIYLLW